jgi:hypothetical protein
MKIKVILSSKCLDEVKFGSILLWKLRHMMLGHVLRSRMCRIKMMLLPAMINALVIIQAVERAEHFVAEIAHGIVQRLQVLLFLVPFQCELRAQQLSTNVAAMAGGER